MARVGNGILADAGTVLAGKVRPGPVLVVTDSNQSLVANQGVE